MEGVSGRVVVIDGGAVLHAPPGWLERWRGQIAGWQPWLRWLAPPAPDGVVLPGSVRVIEVGA